tara:strand:+ start:719 stop:928 length:210 start_codon:yes stop_codon:yes gene_type:complete
MTLAELEAYKDGITDALLEGYMSDWHDYFYYYKRGYQFGIHLQKEIDEISDAEKLDLIANLEELKEKEA